MSHLTFVVEDGPSTGFPPLVLQTEGRNTAGTNAGDWRGYFGGAGNNGVWMEETIKFLKRKRLLQEGTVQVLNPAEENLEKRMNFLPQTQEVFARLLQSSLRQGGPVCLLYAPLLQVRRVFLVCCLSFETERHP